MIDIFKLVPKKVDNGNELFSILKSSQTGYFAAIIAIDALHGGHILAINPDGFDTGFFDDTSLEYNLTGKMSKLEPGVYKCQIKAVSFSSYVPGEPTDYDITVTLEDIEPVELIIP